MKKLKHGDKVQLIWLDAFGRGSWNTCLDVEEGLKHHITCEIIGYFLTQDKNFIVLSMGLQNDPNSRPFLHLEFIPRGAVIKIRKL